MGLMPAGPRPLLRPAAEEVAQQQTAARRRLRHVLGQVVVEMPPVRDLDRFRSALAGAV